MRLFAVTLVLALFAAAMTAAANPAAAQVATPYPGTKTVPTPHSFDVAWQRLEAAVPKQDLRLLAVTSPNAAAKQMGVEIPGSAVFMVFHPRFAIRMLQASVPSGIEAPIRIYLSENPDKTTLITWRTAESVFSPYQVPALVTMAREVDALIEKIVAEAVATN